MLKWLVMTINLAIKFEIKGNKEPLISCYKSEYHMSKMIGQLMMNFEIHTEMGGHFVESWFEKWSIVGCTRL